MKNEHTISRKRRMLSAAPNAGDTSAVSASVTVVKKGAMARDNASVPYGPVLSTGASFEASEEIDKVVSICVIPKTKPGTAEGSLFIHDAEHQETRTDDSWFAENPQSEARTDGSSLAATSQSETRTGGSSLAATSQSETRTGDSSLAATSQSEAPEDGRRLQRSHSSRLQFCALGIVYLFLLTAVDALSFSWSQLAATERIIDRMVYARMITDSRELNLQSLGEAADFDGATNDALQRLPEILRGAELPGDG